MDLFKNALLYSFIARRFMFRIKFLTGSPRELFENAKKDSMVSYVDISRMCGIPLMTLRGWRRGTNRMSLEFFDFLCQMTDEEPPLVKMIDENDPEILAARSRGGLATAKRIREDPAWAKAHRFVTRKPIHVPEKSLELAEFVGALLGDGSLSQYQIRITSDKNEAQYSKFLQSLGLRLFGMEPAIERRSNVQNVTISRRVLVEYFNEMGIPSGNKVGHQVDVPEWIQESPSFRLACLRGLMDTDGCFYLDKHFYRGKKYIHPGIAFTNFSVPLTTFVRVSLERIGLHPTQNPQHHVILRRTREVHEYFRIVGSSNDKHRNKYEGYTKLFV